MASPEQDPQLKLTEDKLQELRRQHREESREILREQHSGRAVPFSKIEKVLEPVRAPLEPSDESLLLIENQGKFLSERQNALLKLEAYLYEQQFEKWLSTLRGERSNSYGTSDRPEFQKLLRDLAVKYGDILDPHEEYRAARKMTADFQDYLLAIEKMTSPQLITYVWRNIADRVKIFNETMLLRDALNIDQKYRILSLSELVRSSMFARFPLFTPQAQGEVPTELEKRQQSVAQQHEAMKKLASLKGTPSMEEIKRVGQELEDAFASMRDYLDKHYHYEDLTLDFPPEKALTWRNELKRIVEEAGTNVDTATGSGKKILLAGEEIEKNFGGPKIEIWLLGKDKEHAREFPVQIFVMGEKPIAPRFVALEEDGKVRSFADYYDDVPDSIERAESIKWLTPEQWQQFIERVLEYVRKYREGKKEF